MTISVNFRECGESRHFRDRVGFFVLLGFGKVGSESRISLVKKFLTNYDKQLFVCLVNGKIEVVNNTTF